MCFLYGDYKIFCFLFGMIIVINFEVIIISGIFLCYGFIIDVFFYICFGGGY